MRFLTSVLFALTAHAPHDLATGSSAVDGFRQAADFGVKCDGVTDDTFALQTALNRLLPHELLKLPAGTCVTSSEIRLRGKRDVAIFGAGKDRTIITATNPLHSAFIVSDSHGVTLKFLQLHSPNSIARSTDANSRGFYVEKSDGITLESVKVRHTAGAGILFYIVSNSKIVDSDVVDNLSDAFHVTGASRNILVQSSRAQGSGDDCFASIGYGTLLNRNIRFLDNSCSDNRASGVSFEGTIGGLAAHNELTRTGVAGIRIASQKVYNTGVVQNITLQDNMLSDVKTRPEIDHAAIMIFSTSKAVRNILLLSTSVIQPRTMTGIGIFNSTLDAAVSNIIVDRSKYSIADTRHWRCFKIGDRVTRAMFKDNMLNEVPCVAR